jgi:hypothetical protein
MIYDSFIQDRTNKQEPLDDTPQLSRKEPK